MRALSLAAALGAACGLAGCSQRATAGVATDAGRTRGELREVTMNLPRCYDLDDQRIASLGHELANTPATRHFEHEESRKFQTNVAARLARYRAWFEQAATEVGLDWRLLAAIAYQESKWDPRAQSDQGAAGVMMLTADTAHAMGIRDRANAQQSIFAGARYLAQVRDKIPERIAEPDRTWLTVAAYNVGFGHLEDARVITQALGRNPDSWREVRAQLPLLTQERWYSHARRGYARGWEPVQFVDRIQRYLRLLERQPAESTATAASACAVSAAPDPAAHPAAAPGSPAPTPAG